MVNRLRSKADMSAHSSNVRYRATSRSASVIKLAPATVRYLFGPRAC
jgi:hypothetical protein